MAKDKDADKDMKDADDLSTDNKKDKKTSPNTTGKPKGSATKVVGNRGKRPNTPPPTGKQPAKGAQTQPLPVTKDNEETNDNLSVEKNKTTNTAPPRSPGKGPGPKVSIDKFSKNKNFMAKDGPSKTNLLRKKSAPQLGNTTQANNNTSVSKTRSAIDLPAKSSVKLEPQTKTTRRVSPRGKGPPPKDDLDKQDLTKENVTITIGQQTADSKTKLNPKNTGKQDKTKLAKVNADLVSNKQPQPPPQIKSKSKFQLRKEGPTVANMRKNFEKMPKEQKSMVRSPRAKSLEDLKVKKLVSKNAFSEKLQKVTSNEMIQPKTTEASKAVGKRTIFRKPVQAQPPILEIDTLEANNEDDANAKQTKAGQKDKNRKNKSNQELSTTLDPSPSSKPSVNRIRRAKSATSNKNGPNPVIRKLSNKSVVLSPTDQKRTATKPASARTLKDKGGQDKSNKTVPRQAKDTNKEDQRSTKSASAMSKRKASMGPVIHRIKSFNFTEKPPTSAGSNSGNRKSMSSPPKSGVLPAPPTKSNLLPAPSSKSNSQQPPQPLQIAKNKQEIPLNKPSKDKKGPPNKDPKVSGQSKATKPPPTDSKPANKVDKKDQRQTKAPNLDKQNRKVTQIKSDNPAGEPKLNTDFRTTKSNLETFTNVTKSNLQPKEPPSPPPPPPPTKLSTQSKGAKQNITKQVLQNKIDEMKQRSAANLSKDKTKGPLPPSASKNRTNAEAVSVSKTKLANLTKAEARNRQSQIKSDNDDLDLEPKSNLAETKSGKGPTPPPPPPPPPTSTRQEKPRATNLKDELQNRINKNKVDDKGTSQTPPPPPPPPPPPAQRASKAKPTNLNDEIQQRLVQMNLGEDEISISTTTPKPPPPPPPPPPSSSSSPPPKAFNLKEELQRKIGKELQQKGAQDNLGWEPVDSPIGEKDNQPISPPTTAKDGGRSKPKNNPNNTSAWGPVDIPLKVETSKPAKSDNDEWPVLPTIPPIAPKAPPQTLPLRGALQKFDLQKELQQKMAALKEVPDSAKLPSTQTANSMPTQSKPVKSENDFLMEDEWPVLPSIPPVAPKAPPQTLPLRGALQKFDLQKELQQKMAALKETVFVTSDPPLLVLPKSPLSDDSVSSTRPPVAPPPPPPPSTQLKRFKSMPGLGRQLQDKIDQMKLRTKSSSSVTSPRTANQSNSFNSMDPPIPISGSPLSISSLSESSIPLSTLFIPSVTPPLRTGGRSGASPPPPPPPPRTSASTVPSFQPMPNMEQELQSKMGALNKRPPPPPPSPQSSSYSVPSYEPMPNLEQELQNKMGALNKRPPPPPPSPPSSSYSALSYEPMPNLEQELQNKMGALNKMPPLPPPPPSSGSPRTSYFEPMPNLEQELQNKMAALNKRPPPPPPSPPSSSYSAPFYELMPNLEQELQNKMGALNKRPPLPPPPPPSGSPRTTSFEPMPNLEQELQNKMAALNKRPPPPPPSPQSSSYSAPSYEPMPNLEQELQNKMGALNKRPPPPPPSPPSSSYSAPSYELMPNLEQELQNKMATLNKRPPLPPPPPPSGSSRTSSYEPMLNLEQELQNKMGALNKRPPPPPPSPPSSSYSAPSYEPMPNLEQELQNKMGALNKRPPPPPPSPPSSSYSAPSYELMPNLEQELQSKIGALNKRPLPPPPPPPPSDSPRPSTSLNTMLNFEQALQTRIEEMRLKTSQNNTIDVEARPSKWALPVPLNRPISPSSLSRSEVPSLPLPPHARPNSPISTSKTRMFNVRAQESTGSLNLPSFPERRRRYFKVIKVGSDEYLEEFFGNLDEAFQGGVERPFDRDSSEAKEHEQLNKEHPPPQQ